jgi:hypothetical protein
MQALADIATDLNAWIVVGTAIIGLIGALYGLYCKLKERKWKIDKDTAETLKDDLDRVNTHLVHTIDAFKKMTRKEERSPILHEQEVAMGDLQPKIEEKLKDLGLN